LGNPFRVETFGRSKAIELYEMYAQSNSKVQEAIRALPSKCSLICFCNPKNACHTETIIKIKREMAFGNF